MKNETKKKSNKVFNTLEENKIKLLLSKVIIVIVIESVSIKIIVLIECFFI